MADVLQGTLDLLVLKTLSLEPLHGWGIGNRIQELSSDVFQVGQGSLYPSLHRLERNGLIEAEWGVSENNRRAKYYQLTEAGREQLRVQAQRWSRYAHAVSRVLQAAET